jgi:phosphoribosylaminoimidazolecarboxamide formyltransferase/IMP cyclohydrolase
MTPIKRALISVTDKTGIVAFAQFLATMGVEILSTGGTAQLLREAGLSVRDVADVTKFPEMMEGRLKTLHPAVHGGLLARRDVPEHMDAAAAHNIGMIDLLVVNLYPFEATLAKTTDYDTLVENIDIGGPAMIRAAAKNHAHVAVMVDPADYAAAQQLLQQNGGEIPLADRKTFAAKALSRTAAYDTLIASWLSGAANEQPWPAFLLDAKLQGALRYGENPHQQAALYQRLDARGGLANAQQIQGKELSYNNMVDAEAAWQIASTLDQPAVVIIKHANPSGVAVGVNIIDAFTKALASDPVSAFGGILATNRAVDTAMVEAIGSLFLEVIIAPEVTADAREMLARKKNLRVLIAVPETHASPLSGWVIQAISGGYLVQTQDAPIAHGEWQLVTGGALNDAQMRDAALAWHVAKYVKSNAIVLVKNGATIGVGAGQMSRVDSVRLAIEKARTHGHDTVGCVLASDAFFPFADNVEFAASAGIKIVVQPGGSMRDAEVIAAANHHGMAMLFTGMRHFRH